MITRYGFFSLAIAAGSVFLSSPPALAASQETFMGNVVGEHGATTHPAGEVKATLDPKTYELRYRITWKGLSGPVQAAHFHGPASFDQDADVLVPIAGPYGSPLSGKVQLDSEQARLLEAGQVYVNLHTQAYPNGEGRAQLVKH